MRKFFFWLMIVVVAFVAFICGTEAGRTGYRQVEASAEALWNDPRLKKARKKAAKKADKVAKKAKKAAKKVAKKAKKIGR